MTQTTECETCGHSYVDPCGAKRRKGCENVRVVPAGKVSKPKPKKKGK